MCKRSLWTVLGAAALAILVVLGAVGLWLAAPLTGRTAVRIPVAEVDTSDFPSPPMQDYLKMPTGYPAGSCHPSANPPPSPGAVAASDCVNNTLPGGPPVARYETFADQNTLNNAFETDVRGAALQACPGSSGSAPGTWNATSPPPASGSVMCYISSDNMAHVEWTNTADLIKANASGPDLASLYGWFHGLITS
jgi:serine/threonine-protein kinase